MTTHLNDKTKTTSASALELEEHDLDAVTGGALTGRNTKTASSKDDVPTEEVAFYYNKIGFSYTAVRADKR